ncbi:MAG: Gfo/Idh/MocA family oxidoreductase [Pseudomonadota bacterium]
MQDPYKVALVGYGKIARDQHIPCIKESPDFELSCLISKSAKVADVPIYGSLVDAFESQESLDAVILCTPPTARLKLTQTAIQNGCAVMLEKPPAVNIAEAKKIVELAEEAQAVVFATWHSRFAAMVDRAVQVMQSNRAAKIKIVWHESVHKWHPGQSWLWEKGAFGVFDMGINALSILTAILPTKYTVTRADFEVPRNLHAPVAAKIELLAAPDIPVQIDLDFLAGELEKWEIAIEFAGGGGIKLFEGGAGLIDESGEAQVDQNKEYQKLYERFSNMIGNGSWDIDTQPLEIVEDAFQIANRTQVAALAF